MTTPQSGTPTKETDAAHWKEKSTVDGVVQVVRADFARKLERERDAARAALRWIPVAERLPEIGLNVLCLVGAGFFPVRSFLYEPTELYRSQPWKDASGHRPLGHFITHWMPLPAAPKEGT